jgi:hypothetical protein
MGEVFTKSVDAARKRRASRSEDPAVLSAAQEAGTKLILLGTGGGPRPRQASSASAQVIVTNHVAYVIDWRRDV